MTTRWIQLKLMCTYMYQTIALMSEGFNENSTSSKMIVHKNVNDLRATISLHKDLPCI
jgi:hypothetical protein